MSAVKAIYILCNFFFCLALLALAVASPVWITPGYYWWTAFGILMLFLQGSCYNKRLNSWDGMGNV